MSEENPEIPPSSPPTPSSNDSESSSAAQPEAVTESKLHEDLQENPVQSPNDQQNNCDVEVVLQRTIDFVVENEQQANFDDFAAFASSNEELLVETNPELREFQTLEGTITKDLVEDSNGVISGSDERNSNFGNDDEETEDDFGDFSEPQLVDNYNLVVTNGEPKNAVDDDDFGDFEEAAGNNGFARFDEPVFEDNQESVAPASLESFRNLIEKLFCDSPDANLVDRTVETGNFHASVSRDMARCEDVDNWPCVLFRFDNSRTRKILLGALCIDETPANCPRFAIDCLSNEFLQPVKESRAGVTPGGVIGGLASTGDCRELGEKAREVLNKIPDLSFMKAEVLTFPAAVQAP